MGRRPLVFKWRHFEPQIILCAVRWYLRFSLSYREVAELLTERGIQVDHSTIWRWVQRYGPELDRRQRMHLKPTNRSWRVDETYVRVQGRWCYLYRAVDSTGSTVEFFMSAFRDLEAAKSLFRRALRDGAHPQPRVINTDLAPTYPRAIAELQYNGTLRRRCRHRPVQYLTTSLNRTTAQSRNGSMPNRGSESLRRQDERSRVMKRCTCFARGRSAGWPAPTCKHKFGSFTSCSVLLSDPRA